MVYTKEGLLHMFPYYKHLRKIAIKYKSPIPIIEEMLDELHGEIYFRKLDLCLGYYQIKMWEEDIPKITLIMNFGDGF